LTASGLSSKLCPTFTSNAVLSMLEELEACSLDSTSIPFTDYALVSSSSLFPLALIPFVSLPFSSSPSLQSTA
jgi:hypothetical protein